MIEAILAVTWLFLPAGFSNTAAAMSRHLKFLSFLNLPVDMGITIKGERLLGKNKTVRGFLAGTLFATLMAFLMKIVYEQASLSELFEIDYEAGSIILLGALLGFGALLGDAVESFFKRRIGVKPGEPWFPFDQIDYIVGVLVVGGWYMNRFLVDEWYWLLALLPIFFITHLIVKFVGFYIGLEDKKI